MLSRTARRLARRRWVLCLVALLVLAAVVGVQGLAGDIRTEQAATADSAGNSGPGGAPAAGGSSVVPRVEIPAIGVASRLVAVGLRPDESMEVPPPDEAGWYDEGPWPGEQGPAVIVGHLTYNHRDGVFARLQDLQPGDTVQVTREAGQSATFVVVDRELRNKEDLPVERIWPSTDRALLSLITCAGTVDPRTGHYTDNLIVYAAASGG